MKNKLLSALLICAMLVGMLAVIPFSASAATTITVASVDDWMSKVDNKSLGNATINVTATELDFTGKNLSPIGGFSGTLNGNGATFKNITMSGTADVALFCDLGEGAVIQNLIITDSTFTASKNWVAPIACCTKHTATIKNIYVSETVTVTATVSEGNTAYAAGIMAGAYESSGQAANVTIENCVFAGSIESAGQYNGGIIADVYAAATATVKNCLSVGSITAAKTYAAGIASGGGTLTVENCIFAGELLCSGATFGDIFAGNVKAPATVKNCYYLNTLEKHNNGGGELTEENNTQIVIADIIGENATVTLEGWTKRANDIMVPTGVAALVPSTADKYTTEYTVTWKNHDGTVLATETYEFGAMPEYKGETPTKAEDDTYLYHFNCWSPEIVSVTGDTTYTAEFYKERKNIIIEDETEADNNGGDNTAEDVFGTQAQGTTTDATTEEEGGCASLIGGGAVVLVAVMGGALVIGAKKKEN